MSLINKLNLSLFKFLILVFFVLSNPAYSEVKLIKSAVEKVVVTDGDTIKIGREKSFEKKFAHDEELQFKVSARKNKYLGQWASQILGYDQEKEKEYIQAVIKSDFEEAGDEDVFRKLKADLADHNISDEEIRKKMNELNEKAKSDFK